MGRFLAQSLRRRTIPEFKSLIVVSYKWQHSVGPILPAMYEGGIIAGDGLEGCPHLRALSGRAIRCNQGPLSGTKGTVGRTNQGTRIYSRGSAAYWVIRFRG